MKGIIIVDIPVDEPVEIDEYCMMADLEIWSAVGLENKDLCFDLKNVPIRPLPQRQSMKEWLEEHKDYDFGVAKEIDGWNACLDFIEEQSQWGQS